jgi:hypothetical protein
MIDASTRVKPMGTVYHGLNMVVSAIDALAALLIGRHDYFWLREARRWTTPRGRGKPPSAKLRPALGRRKSERKSAGNGHYPLGGREARRWVEHVGRIFAAAGEQLGRALSAGVAVAN